MQTNLRFVRTSLQSLLIKAGICDQVLLEAQIVHGNWDFPNLIERQSISQNQISMVAQIPGVIKSLTNSGMFGSKPAK